MGTDMKNKLYDLIPHDKALHFIAGVLIFAVVNLINPFLAIATVCAAAVTNEIWDKAEGGAYSWKDIAFTVAGGLVGLFIALI
jgi:hypothetical protein